MELTFAPREYLEIEDARIAFRNFAGVGTEYNREGDRNFSWVIEDEDIKDELVDRGWNVRVRPARDPEEMPFMHLPIKVKFGDRPPIIKLVRPGREPLELDAESVKCLDHMNIERIDMRIRPYDWVLHEGKPNEKRGRAAYLQDMYVTQRVDRLAARYENYPEDDDLPFDM